MGVDANKVRPEIKETLVKYQLECYDVLYQHFMPNHVSLWICQNMSAKMHMKHWRWNTTMFRQYDDMIDDFAVDQVSRMENKCRRYNFKMHIT